MDKKKLADSQQNLVSRNASDILSNLEGQPRLSRQPKAIKNDNNGQKNHFERLRKRTLRAKIIGLLEQYLVNQCKIMASTESTIQTNELNRKQMLEQEFLQKIKEDRDEYLKRPLVFSKYSEKEFVPTTKPCFLKDFQKNKHSTDDDLFKANDQIETLLAVQKICEKLTLEQVQDITEDPAYYIVKEEHRQRRELLSPQFWEKISGISSDDTNMDVEIKKTFTLYQSMLRSKRNQHHQLGEQKSHLFESLQKQTMTNEQLLESLQKGAQRSEETKFKELEYLITKHNLRFQKFDENSEKLQHHQYMEKERRLKEYEDQIRRADRVIQEIQQSVQRTQEINQIQSVESMKVIHKNRELKRENDEIYLNHIQLRRICVEKQVNRNIERSLNEKFEQVNHLREIYHPQQSNGSDQRMDRADQAEINQILINWRKVK